MQVACQVRSSVTLHSPFIERIGLPALAMESTAVQRLLLEVLIFLQNPSSALVLLLRATNQLPDLDSCPSQLFRNISRSARKDFITRQSSISRRVLV